MIPSGSQKPRFDIDVKAENVMEGEELTALGDRILSGVIEGIRRVMEEAGVGEYSKDRHLVVFNSHTASKRSFHVIVDGFCHANEKHARAFHQRVVAEMPAREASFVDPSVYSSFQAFRLPGCCKAGKDNFKCLDTTWTTRPFEECVNNPNLKVLRIFEAACVSFCAGTAALPAFEASTAPPRLIAPAPDDGKLSEAITLFEATPFASDFNVEGAQGGFIRLNRRSHEHSCPICKRVHENENAFLRVCGNRAYFHCYRTKGKYPLGVVGPTVSLAQLTASVAAQIERSVEPFRVLPLHEAFSGLPPGYTPPPSPGRLKLLVLGTPTPPTTPPCTPTTPPAKVRLRVIPTDQMVRNGIREMLREIERVDVPLILAKRIPKEIYLALSGLHADVLPFLTTLTYTDFKYVQGAKIPWWMWNPHAKLWTQAENQSVHVEIMLEGRRLLQPIIEWVTFDLGAVEARLGSMKENSPDKDALERDQGVLQKAVKNLRGLDAKLATTSFLSKVIFLLQPVLQDTTLEDKLDANPDLFPVQGGRVINLKTREVRERKQEDYFTHEAPVAYDENADMTLTERFFADITLGDEDYKNYLQHIMGFCLTGHTYLQEMYIFYGPSGNGKSTLFKLMSKAMGDFYHQCNRRVFVSGKTEAAPGAPSPHLAALKGKRLATFSETQVGDQLDEQFVKSFTGGELINGRNLFVSGKPFENTAKAMVGTNFRIDASSDDAYWRRCLMFPFRCEFVRNPSGENQRLRDDMFIKQFDDPAVMRGFLRWLVIGAEKMYQGKPPVPACVTRATQKERKGSDLYQRFIKEKLVVVSEDKPECRIKASELYQTFVHWYKFEAGESGKPPSNAVFGTNIKKHLSSHKSNVLWYKNCRLKEDEAPSAIKPHQALRQ